MSDRGVPAGVERRLPLLAAVGEGADRATLVDELGVSAATVDRGLQVLRTANLIVETSGGVRTTAAGELLLAEHERLVGRIDGVASARAVLAALPDDAPVSPACLDDASVVPADGATARPTGRTDRTDAGSDTDAGDAAPVGRSEALVARSTAVDALATGVHPAQATADRPPPDGATVRVALDETALGVLAGRDPGRLRTTFDATDARVRLRAVDGTLPYTLLVARTGTGPVVGLLVPDGGYVETTTREAVDWARRQFDRIWTDADPLPLPVPTAADEEGGTGPGDDDRDGDGDGESDDD
jgi:hypothetical protein